MSIRLLYCADRESREMQQHSKVQQLILRAYLTSRMTVCAWLSHSSAHSLGVLRCGHNCVGVTAYSPRYNELYGAQQ